MSDPATNLRADRSARRPRRFGLLDACVLIAALAFGFWGGLGIESIYRSYGIDATVVVRNIRNLGWLANPYHIQFWFEILAPLSLSLGFALFVLRRLGPRPRRSRLARQPGNLAIDSATFAALALAASSGLVVYPLILTNRFFFTGSLPLTLYPLPFRVLMITLVAVGASVAAGWGRLILDGSSREKADWIEWSGRILGAWLLLATPCYLWSALLSY